jgi:hypothetical protein
MGWAVGGLALLLILLLWAGSAGLALLLVELGAFTVHLNSFE